MFLIVFILSFPLMLCLGSFKMTVGFLTENTMFVALNPTI